MTQRAGSLDLPLFDKELVEMAARPRTYVVRVTYALMLFSVYGIFYFSELAAAGGDTYRLLGSGRRMFTFLVGLQFAGIYLFLPAMMSGAVAYEKEKRTLELLLITDLTDRQIVFQKLGSGLVPMLSFLLLSLPLMAVCYAYGGLSSGQVLLSALLLVTTCVQVGAFTLAVSAYCRTSNGALFATYGYAILLGAGVMTAAGVLALLITPFALIGGGGELAAVLWMVPGTIVLGLVPPAAMVFLEGGGPPAWVAALPILGAWLWTAIFIRRARRYLTSRAFLPAKKRAGFGQALDTFFRDGDGSTVPHSETREQREKADKKAKAEKDAEKAKKGRYDLPGDEPITWREVTRSFLRWPDRFLGALFLTEILFLPLALAFLPEHGHVRSAWGITFLVSTLWIVAAVAVAVRSVGPLAAERSGRTLEVLLCTPLSGEEIVRQKAKGAHRLILLFAAPFLTLFVLEASLEWKWAGAGGRLGSLSYLLASSLTVLVFLPAFAWVSRWIGLKVRNARRAMFLALAWLFIWSAGPVSLVGIAWWFLRWRPWYGGLKWLYLLSPAMTIGFTETGKVGGTFGKTLRAAPAVPIALGLLLNGAIFLFFRRLCLKNADLYLGRPVATAAELAEAARGPSGDEGPSGMSVEGA